jgi:hypothetical protein
MCRCSVVRLHPTIGSYGAGHPSISLPFKFSEVITTSCSHFGLLPNKSNLNRTSCRYRDQRQTAKGCQSLRRPVSTSRNSWMSNSFAVRLMRDKQIVRTCDAYLPCPASKWIQLASFLLSHISRAGTWLDVNFKILSEVIFSFLKWQKCATQNYKIRIRNCIA